MSEMFYNLKFNVDAKQADRQLQELEQNIRKILKSFDEANGTKMAQNFKLSLEEVTKQTQEFYDKQTQSFQKAEQTIAKIKVPDYINNQLEELGLSFSDLIKLTGSTQEAIEQAFGAEGTSVDITANFKKPIDQTSESIIKMSKNIKDKIGNTGVKALKDLDTSLKSMQKSGKNIDFLNNKAIEKTTTKIDELSKEIKGMMEAVSKDPTAFDEKKVLRYQKEIDNLVARLDKYKSSQKSIIQSSKSLDNELHKLSETLRMNEENLSTDEYEHLQDKIKDLIIQNKKYGKTSENVHQLSAHMSKLESRRIQAQINNVKKAMSVEKQRLKDKKRSNQEDLKNREKILDLTGKLNQMEKDLSETSARPRISKENKKELDATRKSVIKLQEELKTLTNQTSRKIDNSTFKQYQRQVKDLEHQTTRTRKSVIDTMQDTYYNVNSLIYTLSRVAYFAGLSLGFQEIIQSFSRFQMEFDRGMREINALLGQSEYQLESYKDEFIDMVKEMPFEITELVEGMRTIVAAGVDAADSFKVLKSATDLSMIGFIDLKASVKTLTTIMDAWQVEADNLDSVLDTLFVGLQKGKFTMDELTSSMGMIAPVAATAGVSLEEIVSGMAALTRVGLPASRAATSLARMLENIVSPADQAVRAANMLGVEMSELALQSLGLSGFVKEMSDSLRENNNLLMEMGTSTTKILREMFPRIQATRAAYALLGSSSGVYMEILDEMNEKQGIAANAIENTTQSLERQKELMKNQLNAAMAELSKTTAPIASWFYELAGNTAAWVSELDSVTIFIGALTTIIASLIPLLASLFKILSKIWGSHPWAAILNLVIALGPTVISLIMGMNRETEKTVNVMRELEKSMSELGAEEIYEASEAFGRMQSAIQKAKNTLKGIRTDFAGLIRAIDDYNAKADLGLDASEQAKTIEKIIDKYPQLSAAVEVVNGKYKERKDLLEQMFNIELNRMEIQKSMAVQQKTEAQQKLQAARESLGSEVILEEFEKTMESTGTVYKQFKISMENDFAKAFNKAEEARKSYENQVMSVVEDITLTFSEGKDKMTSREGKDKIEKNILKESGRFMEETDKQMVKSFQDYIQSLDKTAQEAVERAFSMSFTDGLALYKELKTFDENSTQDKLRFNFMFKNNRLYDVLQTIDENFSDVVKVYSGEYQNFVSIVNEMNKTASEIAFADLELVSLTNSLEELKKITENGFSIDEKTVEEIAGVYTSFTEELTRLVELFDAQDFVPGTGIYEDIQEQLVNNFGQFAEGVKNNYLKFLSTIESETAQDKEKEIARTGMKNIENTFDNFIEIFGDVLIDMFDGTEEVINNANLTIREKIYQINNIIDSTGTSSSSKVNVDKTAEEIAISIQKVYQKLTETTDTTLLNFYNQWLEALMADYESKLQDKLKVEEISESEYASKIDTNINSIKEYTDILNTIFGATFSEMSIEELKTLRQKVDKLDAFEGFQGQVYESIDETITMLQNANVEAIKAQYDRLGKWIKSQFSDTDYDFAKEIFNDFNSKMESIQKQLVTEDLTVEEKANLQFELEQLRNTYKVFFNNVTESYLSAISELSTKANFAIGDIATGLSLSSVAGANFIDADLSSYIGDIETINMSMVNLLDSLYTQAPNVYKQLSQDIIDNAYDVEAALQKFSAGDMDITKLQSFLQARTSTINDLQQMINLDEINESIKENIELYGMSYLSLEDQKSVVSDIITSLQEKKSLNMEDKETYSEILTELSKWETIQKSLNSEEEEGQILLEDKLNLYKQMRDTGKQINTYQNELNQIEQARLENIAEQRRLRAQTDAEAQANQEALNELEEQELALKKEYKETQEEINRLSIQQTQENLQAEMDILNNVTKKLFDYLAATKDLKGVRKDLYLLEQEYANKVNTMQEYAVQLETQKSQLTEEQITTLEERIAKLQEEAKEIQNQINGKEKIIDLEKLQKESLELILIESAKLADTFFETNGNLEKMVDLAFKVGEGLVTGNWMGAITSAVSIVFSRLNDIITANQKINQQEEKHKKNLKEILASYQSRRESVSKISRVQQGNAELKALKDELSETFEQMDALKDDLSYKTKTGFDFWGWIFGTKEGNKEAYQELKDKAEELGVEIKELMKTVRLEYLDAIGFSVDTLVSNMESAFQNATSYEDFVDRFATSMEETLRDALMRSIIDSYVIDHIQELLDPIFKDLSSGKINIEEAIAKLKEIDWEGKGEEVAKIFEEVFGDTFDTAEELAGQINSDANAVRASLTEQTGNRIVAVFNTMNQRLSNLINMMSASNDYTTTFDYLDRITSNLVAINNKLHGIIDVRVVRTLSPRFEIK